MTKTQSLFIAVFLVLLALGASAQQADYYRDLELSAVQWKQTDSNIEVSGVVVNNSNTPYYDVLLSAYCSDSENYRLATLQGRVDYIAPGSSASFTLRGGSPSTVAKVQTAIDGADRHFRKREL